MSISMYDELNSVCLVCEGIVCGVEAYNAMVPFVLHHNNTQKRQDINVVAVDGVLSQEKVTNNLGLSNAIYMADVFHLLDLILPKKFGIDYYSPKQKIVLTKDTIRLWINFKVETKDMQNMSPLCENLQKRRIPMHHTFYVRKRVQEENTV